jgi:hypothetical protein
MVSILPAERTPWEALDKLTGERLMQTLPGAIEKGYNRGQLQQSLEAIKGLTNNPKSSDLDIMLAAMQAGAGIPGSERYLGALIPELTKVAAAKRAASIQQPGEQIQPQPRNREQMEPPEKRGPLPGFMNQQGQTEKFFPTNLGPQGGPGVAPQVATTRQKIPIPDPQERAKMTRDYLNQARASGDTKMTPKDAKGVIDEYVEDLRTYNKDVDEDLKSITAAQEKWGGEAAARLKELYPQASGELEEVFKKYGEEASQRGVSVADVGRFLQKKADNFKDMVTNIEKDLSAPRLYNAIYRGLNGSYKDFEQSAADIRSHIQPLLDEGLYDLARNILSKKGYGAEEREMILHPLDQQSKSTIAKVPKNYSRLEQTNVGGPAAPSTNMEPMKNALLEMKKNDPNFSLVLARKAFEDKGYDWRLFKDALNQLREEGFEFSGDQKSQSGFLDTPPVGLLESLLTGVNLIGR